MTEFDLWESGRLIGSTTDYLEAYAVWKRETEPGEELS